MESGKERQQSSYPAERRRGIEVGKEDMWLEELEEAGKAKARSKDGKAKMEYRKEWNKNNNNNNNLFSIRYSNTLSYSIHKVLLYNIGIKKIGNSRLLVFVYNKIL